MVVVVEGESVNISCTSTGVPVPTVASWIFDGRPAPFSHADTSQDVMVTVGVTGGVRVPLVTLGSVESSLHIEHAQYPAHEGVYKCTGTNSHSGTNSSSTARITVQVQGTLV